MVTNAGKKNSYLRQNLSFSVLGKAWICLTLFFQVYLLSDWSVPGMPATVLKGGPLVNEAVIVFSFTEWAVSWKNKWKPHSQNIIQEKIIFDFTLPSTFSLGFPQFLHSFLCLHLPIQGGRASGAPADEVSESVGKCIMHHLLQLGEKVSRTARKKLNCIEWDSTS